MTWPFENDTEAIVKKLARRSLASEKRMDYPLQAAWFRTGSLSWKGDCSSWCCLAWR